MKCLNCGSDYKGLFCNHCGQKSSIKKIIFLNIFNDFIKLVTNTDKGLFYNFINLTKAPRSTIINYISGKRKNLFLPIQYVILGLTLLTLADYYWGWKIDTNKSTSLIQSAHKGNLFYDIGINVGKMLKSNIKYFLFSYVFIFALPAKLFYKRFTLPEHITIQAFIVGHAAFITLVLFPIFKVTPLTSPVFYGTIFIMTFATFYKKKEVIENFVAAFFVIAVGIVLFFIVTLAIYSIIHH